MRKHESKKWYTLTSFDPVTVFKCTFMLQFWIERQHTHTQTQAGAATHTQAHNLNWRTPSPSHPALGPTCRVLLPPPRLPKSTPPPLIPPSPLEHSLTSVIKMKQVSQSRSGERMWQAGNGQDKEEIYEVLVNLNNSLNERPRESPHRPPVSGSHPSPDILWISLYHSAC